MPIYDLVLQGGTIIDGLRTPRFVGDIAVVDGKIVAPGVVDLHTHYDSQIFWDPWCTMSGWHGVTSVVIGNCGFGFAPCKPEGVEHPREFYACLESFSESDKAKIMRDNARALTFN